MLSIIRLVGQIFGKKLIKLTEYNLSHKEVLKKKTLHYHFQAAKLKTSLDNNKNVVSKWVIIKLFFFLGGGWGIKNENDIKDENEASYFYIQGAR